MNIVVVGKFYTEGFATHISETFEMMGHKVIYFEPRLKVKQTSNLYSHKFKQVKNQLFNLYSHTKTYEKSIALKIKKIVHSNHIDLVLCCHDFLTPMQVSAFKINGDIPIALWFPDHIGVFGKSMFLNADYDFLFFKDPYIVEILQNDLNIKSYYLPECCNPIHHRKVTLSEADIKKYKCDLTTAGNMHPNRVALLKHLKEFDCKIWGNPPSGWMDVTGIKGMLMNEFVANIEKSKAFSAAKIVINNLQPSEIIGVNVRTFEIAGCGAFQLINYRSGLSQLYKDDEMVSYKTVDNLKELILYYLENDTERLAIAERAYTRTINEHTYSNRLLTLLETVKGNGFAYPTNSPAYIK